MNVKCNKILVAYDGSEQSKLAVEYAKKIATFNPAEILVLQVLPQVKYYLYFPDSYMYPELSNKQQALLEFLEDQMLTDLLPQKEDNLSIKVIEGSPKQTIVEYAKENSFDLIITGASGVHGINKLVMGSTSTYVVNHAPCTVLIAK